jgi:hypothetical protein
MQGATKGHTHKRGISSLTEILKAKRAKERREYYISGQQGEL